MGKFWGVYFKVRMWLFRNTCKGAMMCLDSNWRKTGTCGCDRPPPKITDNGWSFTYEYPVMRSSGSIGYTTYIWEYPSEIAQEKVYRNIKEQQ